MKKFTPAQRARVKARAKTLIEEKMTLRDLRQAKCLTQERMVAVALGDLNGEEAPKSRLRGHGTKMQEDTKS